MWLWQIVGKPKWNSWFNPSQRSQNPWKIPDFISHEIPLDPYENSLFGPDVRSRFFMARACASPGSRSCSTSRPCTKNFSARDVEATTWRRKGMDTSLGWRNWAKESHESDILKVRVFVGFHFFGKLDRKTLGRKTALKVAWFHDALFSWWLMVDD